MKTEKFCLLIEDDPDDQEIFIDALHEVSATTGCFAVFNGEEALNRLRDDDLWPDYIFTDLQMPVMDGISFIAALRKMEGFKNIPVVVYSSDASEAQVSKIKQLGVTAIYPKKSEDALKEILKKYFPARKRSRTVL